MPTTSRRQCEFASDLQVRYCRNPDIVKPQLSRKVTAEVCGNCRFAGDGFVELECKPAPRKTFKLGDAIANGLSAVGITKERVSRVLGRPCGCDKRQEAANQIGDKIQEAIFGK